MQQPSRQLHDLRAYLRRLLASFDRLKKKSKREESLCAGVAGAERTSSRSGFEAGLSFVKPAQLCPPGNTPVLTLCPLA
jgi:hypothetical protein